MNSTVFTRQQLAQFLPNHEAIKAFENLFKSVTETLPAGIESNEQSLQSAQQQAAEALSGLACVAQNLSLLLQAPSPVEQIKQEEFQTIALNDSDLQSIANIVASNVLQMVSESLTTDIYIPAFENIAGNANTANKLAKARAINTVLFDGSSDITINAVDSTARAKLAGDSTQDFAAKILALSGLLDISGAAAGQIKFPSAQNVSADANTLDDYEKGTWTPSLAAATSGTITTTDKSGKYTKIGNVVILTGYINVASVSSPVGDLQLTGFPFTCGAESSAGMIQPYGWGNTAASTAVYCSVKASNTYASIRGYNAGAQVTTFAANAQTNAGFQFCMVYRV